MQDIAILLYLQSFATSVSIWSRRWHCQPFRTGKKTTGHSENKKKEEVGIRVLVPLAGFWFFFGFLRIPFLYVHFYFLVNRC
jgi:hypothetical protein